MDVCISENSAKLFVEGLLKQLKTGWTGVTDLPVQLLDENLQTTSWAGQRSYQTEFWRKYGRVYLRKSSL